MRRRLWVLVVAGVIVFGVGIYLFVLSPPHPTGDDVVDCTVMCGSVDFGGSSVDFGSGAQMSVTGPASVSFPLSSRVWLPSGHYTYSVSPADPDHCAHNTGSFDVVAGKSSGLFLVSNCGLNTN